MVAGYAAIEWIYYAIARTYQRDQSAPVVGGGFIYWVSIVILYVTLCSFEPWQCKVWVGGLTILAFTCWYDDFRPLPVFPRMVIQLLAVAALIWQLCYSHAEIWPWWMVPIAAFVAIWQLNAWNFMDGINGITGTMTIAVALPLMFCAPVSIKDATFLNLVISLVVICASLAFLIFNFRNKAKCFAGDVGSVSIAFILMFLWGNILVVNHNWWTIVFFAVYLVDAGLTLLLRLLQHENVFKPHRKHAYQQLVYRYRWNPLLVSSIYSLVQLVVSIIAIAISSLIFKYIYLGLVFLLLSGIYLCIVKRRRHLNESYAR